jgi:hypothetical protein
MQDLQPLNGQRQLRAHLVRGEGDTHTNDTGYCCDASHVNMAVNTHTHTRTHARTHTAHAYRILRYIVLRQKRPTRKAKETYYWGKRDLYTHRILRYIDMAIFLSIVFSSGDLLLRQKRPTRKAKETCTHTGYWDTSIWRYSSALSSPVETYY